MRNIEPLQIARNWNSAFDKNEKGTLTYKYRMSKLKDVLISIDFRNFQWRILSSPKSSNMPWPYLEGASGLSTLLYAIQLELK